MHHIYQTDGFILGSVPRGEANRFFYIFTKNLGLIQGSAQGVRLISSKLRYSLQDYSFSHFSLVKTKEGWRITSAGKIFSLQEDLSKDEFTIFVKVFSLLRRLVTGEEQNEELFKIVRAAALFLRERGGANVFSPEQLANFEYILVLRILHTLGYVGENESFAPFLATELWHQDLLEQMSILSKEVITTINTSLKESHL